MAARKFLELSDAGGDNRKGTKRSSCTPVTTVEWDSALTQGKRLARPARKKRVEIDGSTPLEDMPWSLGVPVISDRFRKFLMREAPGHAQYFEVAFKGPKKLIPEQPYFIVNWLHLCDCIDMKTSEYDVDDPDEPGGPPDYTFHVIRIAPKRVPAKVMICRLKHFEVQTIIDSRLVEKIRAAGITGPQLYDIDYDYTSELR